MKKTHRKVHFYLWLLLFPMLLVVIYVGQSGRIESASTTFEVDEAQQGGRLP